MHHPLDDGPLLAIALAFNKHFEDALSNADAQMTRPRTMIFHFRGENVANLVKHAAQKVVHQAQAEGRDVRPGEAAIAAAGTPEVFTGTVVLCPN